MKKIKILYFVLIFLIIGIGAAVGQSLTEKNGLIYNETGELFTGIHTEYYGNGSERISVTFEKGLKNGPVLVYFENGNLNKKYNYLNGKFDGPFHEWKIDGTVIGVAYYLNGIKNGKWEIYDINGNLTHEIIYSNGKRVHVSTTLLQ